MNHILKHLSEFQIFYSWQATSQNTFNEEEKQSGICAVLTGSNLLLSNICVAVITYHHLRPIAGKQKQGNNETITKIINLFDWTHSNTFQIIITFHQ